LLEYVEDGLPAETRQRFDTHIAACPDCVRYLETYRATIKAGPLAMADDLPAEVPEDLVQAILKARQP
jgi:anti-sigma factor RsiW